MQNTDRKRNVAILGSTGSIGCQALDVIRRNNDLYAAYILTANNSAVLCYFSRIC